MQRLANVHPSDLTQFPNGNGKIPLNASNEGSKILMYNETPLNIDLDFLNGKSDVLHAWEANFWTLDGDTKEIDWLIDVDSLNVVNPPINAIFLTLYDPIEKLNDKAYPMPLIRQIGGQQAIVSSASTVINDGNALLQVIEATLQGHASSDVIINNDGSFTLKGAGTLAAAAVLTHILGTLTVDQAATLSSTLAVVGTSSLDNGGITTNGTGTIAAAAVKSNTFRDNTTGGDQLDLSSTAVTVNGNLILTLATGLLQLAGKKINDNATHNLVDWTAAGLFMKGNPASNGSMRYQGDGANTDWQMGALSTFTGSGTGTYNHTMIRFGVSAGPNFIAPIVQVSGSATQGYDTITSTQAHITLGAVLSFKGWCYLL